MTIAIADVVALAASIANSSNAEYGIFDDPDRYQDAFLAAALNADRQVIATLLGNENSRYFKSLLGFTAVTNGQSIPKKFYAVKIDSQIGKRVDPDRLFLNRNTTLAGVLAACTGEYCIFENAIFFIGTTAEVQVITFTASGSISSPDEFIMLIVAGLLAQVLPVGEKNVAVAGYFGSLFSQMLGAIANDSKLPEMKPYAAEG